VYQSARVWHIIVKWLGAECEGYWLQTEQLQLVLSVFGLVIIIGAA
jgi:hypothetical protein